MHAGIPHQTFQLKCRVQQLPHLRIFLVRLLQRHRLLERIVELDIQRGRHHLCDAVHVAVRNIHRAANVLDRGFGCHRAERDDLRNIFPPVFVGHVFDHFAPPVHAKVDIDIGH